MVFLLLLLYGSLAFYAYGKKGCQYSYITSLFYLSPFIALWIFIIGGQLGVGTDYYSYLAIFEGKKDLAYYAFKREFCFYGIVSFFQNLNVGGQFYFYLFAFLYVLLYIGIVRKITNRNYVLFFFLFVTVSTMVHSQMNGIRQCTAVYFVTLAFLELIQGKKKFFFIYVIIAAGFHVSSIAILLLYFIRKISLTKKAAKYLVIITAAVSFISFDDIIKDLVLIVPQYSHYADSEYLQQGISVLNKMTKLATLPIYYLAISLYDNKSLSVKDTRFFQMGMIAYFIKTVCIVSSVTYRFGHFFFVLSILPIFYYLSVLKDRNLKSFIFWCVYLTLLYCMKILLFPSAEYSYNSIFTTYF